MAPQRSRHHAPWPFFTGPRMDGASLATNAKADAQVSEPLSSKAFPRCKWRSISARNQQLCKTTVSISILLLFIVNYFGTLLLLSWKYAQSTNSFGIETGSAAAVEVTCRRLPVREEITGRLKTPFIVIPQRARQAIIMAPPQSERNEMGPDGANRISCSPERKTFPWIEEVS
jgi:hypothetical protein